MEPQPGTPAFDVLIDAERIRRRVDELAADIRADRAPAAGPPVVVAVLEGARTFATALSTALGDRLPVHGIRCSSYGDGTDSSGRVEITGGDAIPVRGHDVLVLEDIVDTGRTIAALRSWFLARGAASVRVATLLDKPARRVAMPGGNADYVGFSIPDVFVIGYGMDVAGRWRELPDVAVWDPARDDEA